MGKLQFVVNPKRIASLLFFFVSPATAVPWHDCRNKRRKNDNNSLAVENNIIGLVAAVAVAVAVDIGAEGVIM